MRKIAFIVFLIPFCILHVQAQAKLTPAEYTVFASVLKGIYKENRETYANRSEFVFLNETKLDPELELPSERKYKNLVKDFVLKNKIAGIIEKKFPRGAYSDTYHLVSQAEVDELLEQGRVESDRQRAEVERQNALNTSEGYVMFMGSYWTPFFQKYPESSGLHILSRVGFSGRFAMVQVKGDHGWNGFSRTYILKKVTGKWKIISANGTEWIS